MILQTHLQTVMFTSDPAFIQMNKVNVVYIKPVLCTWICIH